jgi:hypothetical protein
MKLIMERWRNWTDKEKVLKRWSHATGTPIEVLKEGISRRDFLKGLGATAASVATGDAFAQSTTDTGETGLPMGDDFGPKHDPDLWVPPDDDMRWTESDWTGLKGFAMVEPDLVEDDDIIARGTWNVDQYREKVRKWESKDLLDSLTGQRATIVHGDPDAGRGIGLERFALDDDRRLVGKYKLPLTWSLMYGELEGRDLKSEMTETLANIGGLNEWKQ